VDSFNYEGRVNKNEFSNVKLLVNGQDSSQVVKYYDMHGNFSSQPSVGLPQKEIVDRQRLFFIQKKIEEEEGMIEN